MTEAVCSTIVGNVVWPVWSERREGLVTRAVVKKDGKETSYPYAHNSKTCAWDKRVTPDDTLKSVLWFENTDGSKKGDFPGSYETTVTLFGWLNFKKLGKIDASGDPERVYTSEVMQNIISLFTSFKHRTGNVRINKIEYLGEKKKDISLFSKYDFTREKHWWFGDYDYFAMDFKVTFGVVCTTPTVESEVC